MYSPRLTSADLRLLEQFEAKTLANGAFGHREHVRVTWIYLTIDTPVAVADRLCRSLLDLAASHGAPERFHRTLTVAWVRIIEAARRRYPDLAFDALVEACPSLLDKDAPLAYYTRDRLYSDEARKIFVEPNVKSLPGV